MRLLLDTHAFLWWITDDPALSNPARSAIAGGGECFLSVASCWEMAIKASLGKLKLRKPVEQLVTEELAENQFKLLDITLRHIARVDKLPWLHRDPFDRLLIAQAMAEKLVLVSADSAIADYNSLQVLW